MTGLQQALFILRLLGGLAWGDGFDESHKSYKSHGSY